MKFAFAPTIPLTLGERRLRVRPKADPAYLAWLDARFFEGEWKMPRSIILDTVAPSDSLEFPAPSTAFGKTAAITPTTPGQTASGRLPTALHSPELGVYRIRDRTGTPMYAAYRDVGGKRTWCLPANSGFDAARCLTAPSQWLYEPERKYEFDPASRAPLNEPKPAEPAKTESPFVPVPAGFAPGCDGVFRVVVDGRKAPVHAAYRRGEWMAFHYDAKSAAQPGRSRSRLNDEAFKIDLKPVEVF